jgi:chromosome segregation ATPase
MVTLQGELLEPDGSLTVGTHHAEAGILSRKSELRELREQVQRLDHVIGETDEQCAALRQQVAVVEGHLERGQQEVEVPGRRDQQEMGRKNRRAACGEQAARGIARDGSSASRLNSPRCAELPRLATNPGL